MQIHFDINASLLAAFAMGLFSSLHCIGMCGSIIGTLTLSLSQEIRNSKRKLLPYVLNYNLGRITSYVLAGLAVGLIEYFLLSLPFANGLGHRFLQIASALVMASAGFYLAGWFPRFAYIEKIGAKIWKRVEPFGRKLIPVKTRAQAFLFGMVWGWLPCGLVYTALALSATSADIQHSAMTMLAFGMGTLPAVMGVGIITSLLTGLSRMQRFRQAVGLLFVLVALLAAFPELNPMRLQHL